MRQFRRSSSPDDYKYLQFQLWKEGVARYTELRVATLAGLQYMPSREFAALKDYTPYASAAAEIYNRILAELPAISLATSKRVAFYSYGAGVALLLDAAVPKWQSRYLLDKFGLDAYLDPSVYEK
jgi:hypothetical protein